MNPRSRPHHVESSQRAKGIARHSEGGYAFQRRATEAEFEQAVRERDDPFGDAGPSTFKG